MQAREGARGRDSSKRRTDDPLDQSPVFVVKYCIKVKAKSSRAAQEAFLDYVAGKTRGKGWRFIEDVGIQAVEVVNEEAYFGEGAYIKVYSKDQVPVQEVQVQD